MAQRVYWIEAPWKGKIGIVPRPRGGDWLSAEIVGWRDAGVNLAVSFLTAEEVNGFDLEAEAQLCAESGIQFISFPIQDRGVPESTIVATTLIQDLKNSLTTGENVVFHCRQSAGRSGFMAAAMLVSVGEEPDIAFKRIAAARGAKVPDTAEQERWVAERAKESCRGERLFENYLLTQGISNFEFEKSHPGKSRKPDYTVHLDREYLFEVKDFAQTDIPIEGAGDPHSRIRQKIDEARKKFKEYKGMP